MSFSDSLATETVKSLPLRSAPVVTAGTSVQETLAQMRSVGLGVAVVVGDENRPVGLFTERTMLDLLVAGTDLGSVVVDDYLEAGFVVIAESDSVRKVWDAVMKGRRFHCVIDGEGQVAGITGQRGMAEYLAEHYPEQVMAHSVGTRHGMKVREGA